MFLCYFKLGISFLKAYQVFYIFLAIFGKYLLKVCSQTTGERTGLATGTSLYK
jgi:hypothetical protein